MLIPTSFAYAIGVRERAVQLIWYFGGRPNYSALKRGCLTGFGADPILILFPLASKYVLANTTCLTLRKGPLRRWKRGFPVKCIITIESYIYLSKLPGFVCICRFVKRSQPTIFVMHHLYSPIPAKYICFTEINLFVFSNCLWVITSLCYHGLGWYLN